MTERYTSELTSPAERRDDSTEVCKDGVAEVFTTGEAFVGVNPHTVSGVGAVRLGKDLLKINLQQNNNRHNYGITLRVCCFWRALKIMHFPTIHECTPGECTCIRPVC